MKDAKYWRKWVPAKKLNRKPIHGITQAE